jgi:hypothetical protein
MNNIAVKQKQLQSTQTAIGMRLQLDEEELFFLKAEIGIKYLENKYPFDIELIQVNKKFWSEFRIWMQVEDERFMTNCIPLPKAWLLNSDKGDREMITSVDDLRERYKEHHIKALLKFFNISKPVMAEIQKSIIYKQ